MIPGIPSAKCIRGPKYTSGGSRPLRYFSTLTHSLPTLELARELRYEWLFSSCHIVTLLCCVVEAQMVCVREGGTPLLVQGSTAVLWLFLMQSLGLHYLSIEPCHRLLKVRLRSASRGPAAP